MTSPFRSPSKPTMGRLAKGIEVETMSQDMGALFLLRRAGLVTENDALEAALSSDVATAKEISQELGGLPLALDQAGAYVDEMKCSLASYRKRRAVLLARRGGLIDDHPLSVAATWSLAFEKVEQQCQASADLLRLCAFLAPDAIPEEMIMQGADHLGPSLAQLTDEGALDEAIAPLLAYSLVRRERETKTLSMHRLVQTVLSDTMDEQRRRQWMERAVLAVNAALFPVVSFETWTQCERCLPHALACVELVERYQIRSEETARLLNQAASYFYWCGRDAEVELLCQHALAICEEQLGPTHPSTARNLEDLACLYNDQGKYRDAEPLLKRALVIREEQLGPTDLSVANRLEDLASLCWKQGKYRDAEPLFVRALAINEEQWGAAHLLTGESLHNLAALYKQQGKHDLAEPLFRRALTIFEQALGPKHPDTQDRQRCYVALLRSMGRDEEADRLSNAACNEGAAET